MKSFCFRLIGITALFALFSLTTLAQVGSTSSLSGAVTDPNGAVIPGASVMVKNNGTGAEFKATTSGNGTFRVPSLPPGTYTVTIISSGFKQAVVQDVKLDAGTPANVNLILEVGAQT